MRTPFILLLLFCAPAFCSPVDDAANIANSGSVAAALYYLENQEPPQGEQKNREGWVNLEFDLLEKAGKSQEILSLAEKVRGKSAALDAKSGNLAQKAASSLGQYAVQRAYLARLVWSGNIGDKELQACRLALIRSYFLQKDGQSGYLSWLRYQQDYGKPSREEATLLAKWMLMVNMNREAVDLLPAIDDNSAESLKIRLRTGLIAAADVAAKISRLKKPSPDYLQAGLEAAVNLKNSSNEILLREMLLQGGSGSPLELQKKYLDYGLEHANASQLLEGEYDSWFAQADKESTTPESRALYYYLGTKANSDEVRQKALVAFVSSLAHAKMGNAALLLFPNASGSELRKTLGAIAFDSDKFNEAAAYWHGLPLSGELLLDSSIAFASAKMFPAAESALLKFLDDKTPLDRDNSAKAMLAAKQLAPSQNGAVAIGKLVTLAHPSMRRDALLLQAEAQSDPKLAAASYLLAANLSAPKDYTATFARLRAAQLLEHAGESAKGIYQWLLAHSKDPEFNAYLKQQLTK